MDYKSKYLKYKNKYLNLKNTRGGAFLDIAYHSNIGGRPYQEDRFSIVELNIETRTAKGEKAFIFSIFDGHGGAGTSEYLNNNLPKRCKLRMEELEDFSKPDLISKILEEEFQKIDNEDVPEMKQEFMGSTGVMCIVTQMNIIVANIADSPAILFNKEGQILFKTKIHDCYNLEELTRINKTALVPPVCMIYNGSTRLNLGRLKDGSNDRGLDMTRAFGDNAYKPKAAAIPDINILPRTSGQFLCMCSDSFLDSKLDRTAPKQKEQDIINEVLTQMNLYKEGEKYNLQRAVIYIVENRVRIVRGDNTTMILVGL
jgi:serine/threonine protein phosphatase PrpC